MNFELTSDQQLFQETTRRFLEDTCPLGTVRDLADDPEGFDRAWWQRGAGLGWTSMLAPESMGGGSVSDVGLGDLALVAFERGRLVSPGPLAPCNIVVAALGNMDDRTSAQDDLAGRLIAGTAIGGFAANERGRSPYEPALSAHPRAEGFVLEGVKTPVEAALQADAFLVTASSPDGPVAILVDPGAAGLTVSPRESVDLVRRFGEVTFDSVEVPAEQIVSGGPNPDWYVDVANCLALAETVGAMDRVFEFTLEWAFDRHTFGRPLASYQELKHRFADMKLWLEASTATTWEAVVAVGSSSPDAAEKLSSAKSYVAACAPELVQDCVQLHGGIGVTWEHDIHLYLRRVTTNAMTDGTIGEHRRRLAGMLLAEA